MNVKHKLCLISTGVLYAPLLLAAEAEPTDASASVPPSTYHSVFEGYRPFKDATLANWRALNEEVGRAGGHIGILREAGKQAAKPAPAEPGQEPVRGAPTAPGVKTHVH